jgi:hypothetical protein
MANMASRDAWAVTAMVGSLTYPDFEAFDRDAYLLTLGRKLLDHARWSLWAEQVTRPPRVAGNPFRA